MSVAGFSLRTYSGRLMQRFGLSIEKERGRYTAMWLVGPAGVDDGWLTGGRWLYMTLDMTDVATHLAAPWQHCQYFGLVWSMKVLVLADDPYLYLVDADDG